MENSEWRRSCCNPYEKPFHNVRDPKNLRDVTDWMVGFRGIRDRDRICGTHRVKLTKERSDQVFIHKAIPPDAQNECELDKTAAAPSKSDTDPQFMDVDSGIQHLNVSLSSLGVSPVDARKLRKSKTYCETKMRKIERTYKDTIFKKLDFKNDTDSEMVHQLKEKFKMTTDTSERLTILSVLPRSWTHQKIQEEFGVSYYMARQSKLLVEKKGILSSPDSKLGKPLVQGIISKVKEFYNHDDVSRQMPGKKDCLSVLDEEGQRVKVQKRLILGSLKEIYQLFKDNNPDLKIGFSKFAELRPKHCVIAGASGSHSVCVCCIHQNVKLMIHGANFASMSLPSYGLNPSIKTYKDCLAKITCNPPRQKCFLNECEFCTKISDFSTALSDRFELDTIEEVTYKQWLTTDRCTFETITKTKEEFLQDFCEKLLSLKKHDFLAKAQSAFFSETKENLKSDEIVLTCDFSENYSFVMQDEVQGWHWTSSMATVHPFVLYYKKYGKPQHQSYVFISDCLNHNTVLVHAFQTKLLPHLIDKFPKLKKIYYFSDGCSAQYKNKKNFADLLCHKKDFSGISAEWHFYATSHGKGACDGVGGTVKRSAANVSLQNPMDNPILTPRQLYEWGSDHMQSMHFFYVDMEEYHSEEELLKERFQDLSRVVGTQRFHAFIPSNEEILTTQFFSRSEDSFTDRLKPNSTGKIENPSLKFSGFVACIYDSEWWVACVLSRDETEHELEVSFFHPSGPATSFCYPRATDILLMPESHILCNVDLTTQPGWTYNLNPKEMGRVSGLCEKRKQFLQ